MSNEIEENPLHDIRPEIAYGDLGEIDLEPFFGAPDGIVADHLRSLASLASVGQLRQVLAMPLDAEDVTREILVDMFVEKKKAIELKNKRAIEPIGQL